MALGSVYVFEPRAVTWLATRLPAGRVTAGRPVHDTATLTGTNGDAGGSVGYRYYASLAGCQADTSAFPGTPPSRGTNAGTVPVTGGTVPSSSSVTITTPGTYYWAAFYSVDPANTPAASTCTSEQLTVTSPSPPSLPLSVLTGSHLPAATVGHRYHVPLAVFGGVAPYTWSLTAGKLPPGLSLSRGGVISGTPTAPGAHAFTITVTDGAGEAARQAFTLTVSARTRSTVSLASKGTLRPHPAGTLVVRIRNTSPAASARTQIRLHVPPGLAITAAHGRHWHCTIHTHTMTCTHPAGIHPSALTTITAAIWVSARAGRHLTATATLLHPAHKTASDHLHIQP